MKTSIKILLLIVFIVGAIAGVLVFAKTIVAPPSKLKLADQYIITLDKESGAFKPTKDFDKSRAEYIRLDDMLKRFSIEGAVEAKVSDKYRQEIDNTYGKYLYSYGIGMFKKSEWPEARLNELVRLIDTLKADKLSNGKPAVSPKFVKASTRISNVVNEYHEALRLSRSTSYKSIDDAKKKIEKANEYSNTDPLKNNVALVNALNALPEKIAKSHYNYIRSRVNALRGYAGMSKSYYLETFVPQTDNEFKKYKNATFYGHNKLDISDLEHEAERIINDEALNYYNNL